MNILPVQTLLLSLTMLSCSHQADSSSTSQTADTSLDTAVTTDTASAATTTAPGKVTVLSFSTSEGEMVTERVLTIELDGQTQVSVECSADTDFGDFEEKHAMTASSPAVIHTLRLNGLLADTNYQCATVSAAQNASTVFMTGSLPNTLVNLYESPIGTPPAGYMLFNTFGSEADLKSHWLVIQDYSGNVRWYVSGKDGNGIIGLEHEPEAGGVIAGGGFTGNGGALYPPSIYDLSGTLIERVDVEGDHDIDYRNGSVYFPVSERLYSCIQRWSIDAMEQTWEWCEPEEAYRVNSIAIAEDESAVLMTTYGPMEGIAKVDINSGETVWKLKPDGSGDLSVDVPIDGLYLQHDVSIVDCDKADHDICFLVYDNGSAARGYSQILSYGVNETKMTATLIRSFSRQGWYEPHSGGIHQRENGEWLITMGSLTKESRTSYLIVDPQGNELWEMTSNTTEIGGYRARDIGPCDIFNHTGMCPN